MLKCEKEDRKEEARTITQWESWSGEEKNRNNHWRNRLQTLPKSNLTIAALVSQSPEWPHKSHPRLCFHDRAKLLWLNTQEYGMIKVSVVLRGDWDMIYYIVLTGRLLRTKKVWMHWCPSTGSYQEDPTDTAGTWSTDTTGTRSPDTAGTWSTDYGLLDQHDYIIIYLLLFCIYVISCSIWTLTLFNPLLFLIVSSHDIMKTVIPVFDGQAGGLPSTLNTFFFISYCRQSYWRGLFKAINCDYSPHS